MYCSKCGTQLPDDAKFCQNCGAVVGTEQSNNAADTDVLPKEKRRINLSPRLKKLLAVLGGVVVVILAVVLIVAGVREHKRTTILGKIPDPEAFFGLSGEHDYWEALRYEHWITFETDKITQDMMEAYVELLCSNEYPFVLNETIPLNGGMVRYVFLYNGTEELYDAYSRQIMVEYSPKDTSPHTKVEISNSRNFELVQVEPYTSGSVSGDGTASAYAPDPEFFFNTGAAEKGDNSMMLVLSGTPGVAVFEYISALKDSYGMTEVDSYTEAETWQWRLQKGGDENATVSIALDKRGDGDWDLSFVFGENVTLLQSGTQSGNHSGTEPGLTPTPTRAPTRKPTPTPTPKPVVSGPTLPDPAAFFGGVTPVEDEPADTSGWHVYYRLEIDDGWTATHEYLELLKDPRFHFEQTDHFSNTVLYLKSEYYFFDYTGNGSVTPAGDRYYFDGYQDFSSDVFIWIQKNGQSEYTSISIYYSTDLLVADLGDRASTVPDGVPGGNSGSGGSSTSSGSNNTRTPCSICNRTGNCQTCGGDGYLWSSASDKEDRNCYSCRNHNGKCTNCNGTGWRD